MRPPSSSKSSKRTSDEDRGRKKKKKMKSKSSKHRRDSSVSSFSSSSDSDLDSRSWRKSSRSKKITRPDKRKKHTRKLEKKRNRGIRKKRPRRDSSVSSLSSYSSHSCSTCSDRSRSRSPVRQSKSRKRERERARKSSRGHERSHSSRRRSPSCSTCSGSRSDNSARRRSRGRIPVEEKYREESETRRLRSVLTVPGADDEGKDKIIQAYDDHPSCRSDERYYEGNKDQDMEMDSYRTQISDRVASSEGRDQRSKLSGAQHEGEFAKDYLTSTRDDDDRWQDSLVCKSESAKGYTMTKGTEVPVADSGKEADELELILRQKALENLRKFRVASKLEPNQGSKMRAKASESTYPDPIGVQSRARGASSASELKARSVPSIPTEKDEGNRVHNRLNNSENYKASASSTIVGKALNSLKPSEMSSSKMPSKETLMSKDAGNNSIAVQPGSDEVSGAEVGKTDRLVSRAANAENEDSKPNEPLLESASGSQFEKKTFSRMHDGETVKVSYKVYIPNKTPALARRQLQR